MNFNDVLKTKVADIERPPLLPVGTYKAVVKKIPSMETSGDGKWDFLDFQLGLIAAEEDVDADALKEYGGLSAATIVRQRFMFNKEDDAAFKRTLFNVKRFLYDHLQIAGDDNSNLMEVLNQSVNSQCLVFMKWRADKNDAEIQYSEIGKTAPIG